MGAMVDDAEFLLEDGRDPLARPHVAQKAVGFGAVGEQSRQPRPLLGGQARRRSWGQAMDQGLGASCARPLEPLAHRARGHAQRLGNRAATPPLLVQGPGAEPPPFVQLLVGGCDSGAHPSWCTRRSSPFTS